MSIKFKDKYDKTIILRKKDIKHISRHMQLNDKIYIIERTLKYPDLI